MTETQAEQGAAADDPLDHEMSVQVRLVDTGSRAWFHLRGSLVVHEAAEGGRLVRLFAPAERVVVLSPGHRIRGVHLLWIPAFMVTGAFAVAFADLWWTGPDRELGVLALPVGVVSLAVFVLMLRSFVRGSPTARIQLQPSLRPIEFWHKPGRDRRLDEFLLRLKRLQNRIAEPARIAVVGMTVRRSAFSVPLLIAITALFALCAMGLAMRFDNWYLMLLAALPLAAFVVWKLWRRGGIKELSEASRAWARGDADGAIDMLGAYVARHPRQIAAWKMLIDIHLDRGEFGEATQCCNAMEALGVLDPIELTGARNYVAMRRELDERAKGAGLLDTPGGDAPPSDESSDGSTHDA